jgi:methionine synthase II (cobalamin-independent)
MLQALIGPATKLLGKFIEDKDTKNKLAHDLATMAEKHAQELAKGQIQLPELNTGELMTLTLSLLGLGGMRSFEKTKGVARENLKK